MTSIVILRRCATLEEALVVDSLLKAGGFNPSIGEYYVGTIQWDALAAIGGVTVWIREDEAVAAAQYIIDMRTTAHNRLVEEFGSIDTSPLSLRWGRAGSMMFLHLGGGIFVYLALAWALSLLPIDWAALTYATSEPSGQYYYGNGSDGPRNPFANFRSEGFIYVLMIVVVLVADLIDIAERKRSDQTPSIESG
ncbi:MAG: hypothetical protein AAFS13_02950 [Pseudomonadota bacterium]